MKTTIPIHIKLDIDNYFYKNSTPNFSDAYSLIFDSVSNYVIPKITDKIFSQESSKYILSTNYEPYISFFNEILYKKYLQLLRTISLPEKDFSTIPQAYREYNSHHTTGQIKSITKKLKSFLSTDEGQALLNYQYIKISNHSTKELFKAKYMLNPKTSNELFFHLDNWTLKCPMPPTINNASSYVDYLNKLKSHSKLPQLIEHIYLPDDNFPLYILLANDCQNIICEALKTGTQTAICDSITRYLSQAVNSLLYQSNSLRIIGINRISDSNYTFKNLTTIFDIYYFAPFFSKATEYFFKKYLHKNNWLACISLLQDYIKEQPSSPLQYTKVTFYKNDDTLNELLANGIFRLVSSFCQKQILSPFTTYIPLSRLPSITSLDYFLVARNNINSLNDAFCTFAYSFQKSLLLDIYENILPYIR